jgi:hypothetical protein
MVFARAVEASANSADAAEMGVIENASARALKVPSRSPLVPMGRFFQ